MGARRALGRLLLLGWLASEWSCAPPPGARSEAPTPVATSAAVDRPSRGEDGGLAPSRLRYRLVARWPHDRTAFTQGLVWSSGNLYESLGLYGRSELRRVTLETGTASARTPLLPSQFAEGLALAGEELVQLTWKEGLALRYRQDSFVATGSFQYDGEGWGLAFDGARFWMSDGTDLLRLREGSTFAVAREVRVTEQGSPLGSLNELEWAEDVLWANVWMSERIVRIDPASGRVTGSLELGDLLMPQERLGTDVLNGIAWVPERRTFLITGKLWPAVFEIEILD